MYTCVCVCVRACVPECMYVCVCMCAGVHACMCVFTRAEVLERLRNFLTPDSPEYP